eukprot:6086371-Amphidinium_carterae.1
MENKFKHSGTDCSQMQSPIAGWLSDVPQMRTTFASYATVQQQGDAEDAVHEHHPASRPLSWVTPQIISPCLSAIST